MSLQQENTSKAGGLALCLGPGLCTRLFFFHQYHKTRYIQVLILIILLASVHPSGDCPDIECSAGEEAHCTYGTSSCKQCEDGHFKVDKAKLSDKKTCSKKSDCSDRQHSKFTTSKTEDNECGCDIDKHLDGMTCIPNQNCPKGYGQTGNGICKPCSPDGYSDTTDRYSKCQKLTSCTSCVIVKSDSKRDNVCGKLELYGLACVASVTRTSTISQPHINDNTTQLTPTYHKSKPIYTLFFILLVPISISVGLLIIFCCKKRKHKQQQLEIDKTLQRCEADHEFNITVLWTVSPKVLAGNLGNKRQQFQTELMHQYIKQIPAYLENFETDHQRELENDKCHSVMRDWRRHTSNEEVTVQRLFKVMRECGFKDLIYTICVKSQEEDRDMTITTTTTRV